MATNPPTNQPSSSGFESLSTATAAIPIASSNSNPSHRIRFVPNPSTRRSLRFDAVNRDLKEGGVPLRIGRFTDRSESGLPEITTLASNKLAFKSKIVSRAHAEIWVESGGRFFIKDTMSSSGTFLNHVRLSPANTESKPYQIKDGDILQLGVAYQGGAKDMYKSVEIRIEVGSKCQSSADISNTNSNSLKNFLKSHAPPPTSTSTGTGKQPTTKMKLPSSSQTHTIPDCPVCLFSINVRQALFIAPCCHIFHYKCIRPLLESHHPAFSCSFCYSLADLDEDVEVEIEQKEAVDLEEFDARLDNSKYKPECGMHSQAMGLLTHRPRPRISSVDSFRSDLLPLEEEDYQNSEGMFVVNADRDPMAQQHSYHNSPTNSTLSSKFSSKRPKYQGRRFIDKPSSSQSLVSSSETRHESKGEANSLSPQSPTFRGDPWNLDQRLAAISAKRPISPTSSSSSYGSAQSTRSRASSWSKSPGMRIPGTSREVMEFPFGYPTPD